MKELCLHKDLLGIPHFDIVAQVCRMVIRAELPGQQAVWSVGQYKSAVAVEMIEDIHIVLGAARCVHRIHDPVEVELGRLDQHYIRA